MSQSGRSQLVESALRNLFGEEPGERAQTSAPAADAQTKTGLLPRQQIRSMIHRKIIAAPTRFEETQLQPASLDLRLGQRAYRIRASFLPGQCRAVAENLAELS